MDGREQENTVVSLQRDEFVMIQAAFSKGCRTLPFLQPFEISAALLNKISILFSFFIMDFLWNR